MLKLLFFFLIEILVIFVFRQHYKGVSRTKFYLSLIFNALLSIYFWILYNEIRFNVLEPDNPLHVLLNMSFAGAVCAILIPRVILIVLHFSSRLFALRKSIKPRFMTNTGILLWIAVLLTVVYGSTKGRYNFKTERISITVQGLHPDLNGLRIVHISDLHLAGFHKQFGKLSEAMDMVMAEKPDILINSGDFITIGQGEFGRHDTILSKASGKIATIAVLGNHDIGTYNRTLDAASRDTNVARMEVHIRKSGYQLLKDSSIMLAVGNARLAIAGTVTRGRHPGILHGDLKKALSGTDSSDYTVLISHDPNHWSEEVVGKHDADLTLAGHTHGMQLGIITKWFRWSPSKYFYPNWGGLYSSGSQHLYVNLGLGVLGIPFRIGIPPEITVIELNMGK